MRRQGRRDTSPELALRSALHRAGLRFRVDFRPEPSVRSKPDIVFTAARVAVFVDGCFWHGCPLHGTVPKSNTEWWIDKIGANRERDARHRSQLTELGWTCLEFWEHDDPLDAAAEVIDVVRSKPHRRHG